MAELQDNDLVTQIQQGNELAFEVIFLRYYSLLCQYASTIVGNRDSGEEVVQDMFVKLWENRRNLNISSSFRSYLYRSVHNQCINHIESRKVRRIYSQNNVHQVVPFAGDYPIANLIAKELEEKIKNSIDALPEQCREVFLLIRIQNKSYQDVAKKLNISLNTVKTQMQRAIMKMKRDLQEYLPFLLYLLLH